MLYPMVKESFERGEFDQIFYQSQTTKKFYFDLWKSEVGFDVAGQ